MGQGGEDVVQRLLGHRLRQARLEAGFSGTQLARLVGRSQPYISDLERGQRTPSLPTLQAIAAALGKPASFFLDSPVTELAMTEAAATEETPSPSPSSWGCFLLAAGHLDDPDKARHLSQMMAAEGVQSFLFTSRRELDSDRLNDLISGFLAHTLEKLDQRPKPRSRFEDFDDLPRRKRLSRADLD